MCYSAMVQQNAKKYGLRFNARVQTDMYYDLFRRRADGERLYVNKGMEQQFLVEPESTKEKQIGDLILRWHAEQKIVLAKELEKQELRLEGANKALEKKVTKKAENDRRVSSNKISKIKLDIRRHDSIKIESEAEERIYPLHYLSMVCVDENNERVVRPVRYLMRPHNKDESFDTQYNGCYNARFDTIDSVPWWKDSLSKRHGLILMKKFYENVEPAIYRERQKIKKLEEESSNLVVCFEPDGTEFICVPALWDSWKSRSGEVLYSAALITDDPLPEVSEAGHDRTPIVLSDNGAEEWLQIRGKSLSQCKADLVEGRSRVHFSHRIM